MTEIVAGQARPVHPLLPTACFVVREVVHLWSRLRGRLGSAAAAEVMLVAFRVL